MAHSVSRPGSYSRPVPGCRRRKSNTVLRDRRILVTRSMSGDLNHRATNGSGLRPSFAHWEMAGVAVPVRSAQSGPPHLGLSPDRARRQDVVDGDLPDLMAVDHDRDRLSLLEIHPRAVALGSRIAVDLDLAIDQIHDPVHRNSRRPVDGGGQLRSSARLESATSTTRATSSGPGCRPS